MLNAPNLQIYNILANICLSIWFLFYYILKLNLSNVKEKKNITLFDAMKERE